MIGWEASFMLFVTSLDVFVFLRAQVNISLRQVRVC